MPDDCKGVLAAAACHRGRSARPCAMSRFSDCGGCCFPHARSLCPVSRRACLWRPGPSHILMMRVHMRGQFAKLPQVRPRVGCAVKSQRRAGRAGSRSADLLHRDSQVPSSCSARGWLCVWDGLPGREHRAGGRSPSPFGFHVRAPPRHFWNEG